MKVKSIYQCEYCLSEYKTSKEAMDCEAKCLKLTRSEYEEYLYLLKEEKAAFAQASSVNNEWIRKRCDDAVKAVIKFQEEHGIADGR